LGGGAGPGTGGRRGPQGFLVSKRNLGGPVPGPPFRGGPPRGAGGGRGGPNAWAGQTPSFGRRPPPGGRQARKNPTNKPPPSLGRPFQAFLRGPPTAKNAPENGELFCRFFSRRPSWIFSVTQPATPGPPKGCPARGFGPGSKGQPGHENRRGVGFWAPFGSRADYLGAGQSGSSKKGTGPHKKNKVRNSSAPRPGGHGQPGKKKKPPGAPCGEPRFSFLRLCFARNFGGGGPDPGGRAKHFWPGQPQKARTAGPAMTSGRVPDHPWGADFFGPRKVATGGVGPRFTQPRDRKKFKSAVHGGSTASGPRMPTPNRAAKPGIQGHEGPRTANGTFH